MTGATMRALVLVENGKLELRDVERPTLEDKASADDPAVIVRIAACGVCGSDIPRAFRGGAYHYPLILGHEFAGIVEEVAAGSSFTTGEAVAVFPLIPCLSCSACSVGSYAQCVDYDYLGSRSDGAFAEYSRVPESNLFRVPAHLDLTQAALTEPVSVALHGVNRLDITPGGKAAVFGGGPIGLLVAQWLRIRGCSDIYVVEVDLEKQRLSERLGFITVDATACDPVEMIRDRTDGGVDYAVEACGLPLTFRQSLAAVAVFGQVVFMGNIKASLELSPDEVSSVLRRELSIRGTWNSTVVPRPRDDWSTALEYMGRGIDVESIISHVTDLHGAQPLLEAMNRGSESFLRVLVRPGGHE